METKQKEAQLAEEPKEVTSDIGTTQPTKVFGGDGVTPHHEWPAKYAEIKKQHAAHNKKMHELAVEHAGVIQTTDKK